MANRPFADPENVRKMLDVVEAAYPGRSAQGIDEQVDLLRQFFPELFITADIAGYRRDAERRIRAAELDDWPEIDQ